MYLQPSLFYYNRLDPHATCPSLTRQNFFAPRLLAGASHIVRSPTQAAIFNATCDPVSLTSSSSLAPCECPAVRDAQAIDWPQSLPHTLVHKPCAAPFFGSITRWCSASCHWVLLRDHCQLRSCPPQLGFGVAWPRSRPGSLLSIPCVHQPFEPAMTRRCGQNGEWGPVELGSCACPAEPDWPSTPGNAYAVRQCPEGFQGAVRRRCSRMGEWGEAMWDCRSLACPAERVGALAFPETPAGKSVEVGCGSPFVGWMRRECDAQGKWKAVEDACRMQTCSEFRFSLDAANSLFVFYLGNVSSTHLEMTVRSAGNRTFSAQGSHVHSDPLEASIPHEISIAAWNGSALLDACFIQNVVVADTCVEIEPPFLVSMDASRRPTFGIVFPHCGTLSPASFLFSVVAIPSSECDISFAWSEEFACEDDEMAHCASREIAHVSVPRSLPPQCVYQASYALTLDKSTRLPLESPLFSFQPASLCPEFTFDISTSLVSIDFVAVSWFASRPLVYHKIVLRLGVAASRPRQLTSLDASQIQVRPVCTSVAACHKLSMITVPVPKRDAWIVVNVQAETEDMCSPHLEASSAFYAFPSIVTRVEVVLEDSYLRLNVLHVSVPAWIDVSVFNVLGEEYKHVTHPLFYRNLTTLTVGGLHPNSRYRVTWRISDHSQFAVQNQTQIVTKPFHPPELKLHVLYAGSTSILVRFWASITAQARCRFAPSETDSKSGSAFESNAEFESKSQSRTEFESKSGSNSASNSNPQSKSSSSLLRRGDPSLSLRASLQPRSLVSSLRRGRRSPSLLLSFPRLLRSQALSAARARAGSLDLSARLAASAPLRHARHRPVLPAHHAARARPSALLPSQRRPGGLRARAALRGAGLADLLLFPAAAHAHRRPRRRVSALRE